MEERLADFAADLAASLPIDQTTAVTCHHLGVVVQQCGLRDPARWMDHAHDGVRASGSQEALRRGATRRRPVCVQPWRRGDAPTHLEVS